MYLKNHFIWLENNFDKQQDLYVLNSISRKGQERGSFNNKIKERLALTEKQEQELSNIDGEFTFSNITELYQVVRKLDKYPTANNFA